MVVYIAVHGGAGVHARYSDPEVKRSLRLACTNALRALDKEPSRSLDAVEMAVSVMEDSPFLNAGHGSNLTLHGAVECDASIMDGSTGDFGSVGAVSGVKNPVKLAHAILKHSKIRDHLGRIPPLTLVGEGARSFAASKALEIVDPSQMVSPSAREDWHKWAARLVEPQGSIPEEENVLQDTVGAVACDSRGDVASGVSSGGLLLKLPGRVGEAALFGSGCWAQQTCSYGMACSVSGAGEHIIRVALARTLGETLRREGEDADVHEILRRVLLDGLSDNGILEPSVGVLLLVRAKGDDGQTHARLWCAFNTESMAIAYASSLLPAPKAMILRRPPGPVSPSSVFITALTL